MNTLPPPTTTMSEILYRMINGEKVSERQMQLNSFRSRVSDLSIHYGLTIQYEWKKFSTRFNRSGMYRVHFLDDSEREKAIKVYKDLMKQKVANDIEKLVNKMKV